VVALELSGGAGEKRVPGNLARVEMVAHACRWDHSPPMATTSWLIVILLNQGWTVPFSTRRSRQPRRPSYFPLRTAVGSPRRTPQMPWEAGARRGLVRVARLLRLLSGLPDALS
jgi:hypothetical protein